MHFQFKKYIKSILLSVLSINYGIGVFPVILMLLKYESMVVPEGLVN